jgi:hypothetical protein
VGQGIVAWTTGCEPATDHACILRRRSVAGGPTRGYRLQRASGLTGGVVSPDGRHLAVALSRPGQDPRAEPGRLIAPSQLVIIDLDTGQLDVAPGMLLPTTMPPALAFSTDSRWLIIAINAGNQIRLLLWRPGLPLPYETNPIPGPQWGPPAILTLPPTR